MRIAICGPERQKALNKVEKSLGITSKKPWEVDGKSTIIDYAAETYKYNEEENVLFDGSAFDFLGKSDGEGYDDVYEEIALASLANIDYLIIITTNMDANTLKSYEEYSKLYPTKFYLYTVETEFEVV